MTPTSEQSKRPESYPEQIARLRAECEVANHKQRMSARDRQIFEQAQATVPENPSRTPAYLVSGATALTFIFMTTFSLTEGFGYFSDKQETAEVAQQHFLDQPSF